MAWLSIVGEGLHENIGVSARAATALAEADVNIAAQSQPLEEICMNYIVEGKDGQKALRALHKEFFE
jgi:aspartate kinase